MYVGSENEEERGGDVVNKLLVSSFFSFSDQYLQLTDCKTKSLINSSGIDIRIEFFQAEDQ